MEKHTDRILWTVLILALGVSLFLIFLPFSKTTMNTVHDKLTSIYASQVSDLPVKSHAPQVSYMPMTAVYLLEKNHVIKQECVGAPDIIAKWNVMNWHLVPNKPNGQMYLSIAADYDVKNIYAADFGVDGDSVTMDFHVNADGGQGILPQYRVTKKFSKAAIGTSPHGTMYERWKLPLESTDNVNINRVGVSYIGADKFTIDNVRIGLEGGSFKLE